MAGRGSTRPLGTCQARECTRRRARSRVHANQTTSQMPVTRSHQRPPCDCSAAFDMVAATLSPSDTFCAVDPTSVGTANPSAPKASTARASDQKNSR